MADRKIDEAFIERIANNVFGDEPGWDLPIDLNRVADRCWVSKIECRPLDNPGMVVFQNGSYVIFLNSRERLRSRQRFTLAHEISHILLSQGNEDGLTEYRDEPDNAKRNANIQLERQCDKLAARLLMPTSLFVRHAPPWAITSIPRLARQFDTSMSATAIRFAEVMPTPCVTVLWRPSQKGGGRLLPAWHVQNGLCGRSRFHGPTLKRITKASAIYEAFQGNDSTEGTMLVPDITKRGAMYERMKVEALGYGTGDSRRVISLLFPAIT